MTDIQGRSYTYNNGNQLLNYGNVGQGFSLAYDANGNMVSKTDSSGTTSYVYDSENRLVQLTTPNAQVVTYKYDPFGRRIAWQLGSNLQKSFDKMLSLGKIRGQIFMERTESGLHIIQPLVCKEKGGQIFIVYKTVSNRLTDIQQRSYTYNNGNELLNYDGVSFQYDANGNIVSKTDSSGTKSKGVASTLLTRPCLTG